MSIKQTSVFQESIFSVGKAFAFTSCLTLGILVYSAPTMADEEFYGRVESRPEANAGIWTISGQQVQVTDKTKFDLDHGPLVVGACAEVEHKKGVATEIETAKPAKCEK